MPKKLAFLFLIIFVLSACGQKKVTPQTVIDSFKAAGLEAENQSQMTPQDYGLAPMADEGIRFFIPSLCADCGGRILYCKDTDQLGKIKEYYDSLGKSSAAFFSWVFVKDNILVQINGELPEEQARKYEAALNEIN